MEALLIEASLVALFYAWEVKNVPLTARYKPKNNLSLARYQSFQSKTGIKNMSTSKSLF
jgi:hypothetical protein